MYEKNSHLGFTLPRYCPISCFNSYEAFWQGDGLIDSLMVGRCAGPVLPAASPDAGAPREGAGPPQAHDGATRGGAHQEPGTHCLSISLSI